ncbi:NAD/NADP octopine/nopaline dehydrogenase family protein [bacterium]|nr:NAD/NADP octopine/nopaline dehydrogenase family protein [bacterium]
MNIGILGAGHGGLAMAADLTLAGQNIKLSAVSGHDKNIKILKALGNIHINGVTSIGNAPFDIKTNFVCEDIKETINFADIIMIVTPAFAQDVYNELIINHGKKGQIVVFPCGGFSALNFYNELKIHGRENDFIVGETASLIYTTKITGPAEILIKSIKNRVQFSALPENRADYALEVLNKIYPQFYKAENVWQTSFNNPSSILHTVTTLLNMSRIEMFGSYKNSFFDITPSVARVMEKLDKERLEIAKHFYSNPLSLNQIMCSLYNLKTENIYETIKSIKAYTIQRSPEDMTHRYVSEDIPYSLVPIASLGRKLNLKTTNMDSIINIACMCNDKNYWANGRTADKLGFSEIKVVETV